MFDKLFYVGVLLYVSISVEDRIIENWFHYNMLPLLINLLQDLVLLKVDQINVQIFSLYANSWKVMIKIIETEV